MEIDDKNLFDFYIFSSVLVLNRNFLIYVDFASIESSNVATAVTSHIRSHRNYIGLTQAYDILLLILYSKFM